jgi:hypothetical protein
MIINVKTKKNMIFDELERKEKTDENIHGEAKRSY